MHGFQTISHRKQNTERSLQMIDNPSSAEKKNEKINTTSKLFPSSHKDEFTDKESTKNTLFNPSFGIQTPSEETSREKNYSLNTNHPITTLKGKIDIVFSHDIPKQRHKESICTYTAITSGVWDTRFSISKILQDASSLDDIFADGRATPFERSTTPFLDVKN